MKKLSGYRDDLYNFAVGFFMGGANVIPGVSGGTMLFIMGAFAKLTNAIRDIACMETLKMLCRGDWRGLYHRIQWRFLAGVGVGVLFAFATLAKVFVWMLEKHQQLTFAFFFGLIAASIITVNRQIKKWTAGAVISFIISTAVAFGVVSLVPLDGGTQWYMMILYGAICIIAMILPGLSGSFLLLIFGQYQRVWDAVGNLVHLQFHAEQLFMLCCLALGSILGLGAFVHLLNFLMKNFYNATVAALIGFMVGAIPRLWPWQHQTASGRLTYDAPDYASLLRILAAAAAGLALVMIIEFFARNKKQSGE